MMSHGRQLTSRNPTSNSRVSVSRVQDNTSDNQVTGTLRLRAEDDASATRGETPARHIRWSQDVVDNEGMGKKSSKGNNRETPQSMTDTILCNLKLID
jgi:protein phosphatase 1 regulatory subunit 11